MKRFQLVLLLALTPTFLLSSTAMAKHGGGHQEQHFKAEKRNPKKSKKQQKYERHDFEERHSQHPVPQHHVSSFDDDRRAIIRSYLHQRYSRHCPPGLAMKHNGCLPPGHFKRYQIGGFLPAEHYMLPNHLVVRLGPPPTGAYYAMVDEDVVLVAEASKKIIDAITLLSAVD
jgi:Ni/Co efflux regulator RcnB